jgi:hypothetical protein
MRLGVKVMEEGGRFEIIWRCRYGLNLRAWKLAIN